MKVVLYLYTLLINCWKWLFLWVCYIVMAVFVLSVGNIKMLCFSFNY